MKLDLRIDRLWIDVTVAVLVALAAAGLALDRAGFWDPSDTVVLALILATAALAIASTLLQALDTLRSRRAATTRELYDDLLSAATWAVVDATGLDPRDLALAAYRLEHPFLRPARLARVHRVRARRRPVASGVRWAPGKGVIGQCVASGAVVARDLTSSDTRPDEEGLTTDEHTAVHGKYAVVVAVPLVDDTGQTSAVTGCLALDGPTGTLDTLTSPDVLAVLEATSRTLQRLTGHTPPATGLTAADGTHRLHTALQRQDSPPHLLAAAGERTTR